MKLFQQFHEIINYRRFHRQMEYSTNPTAVTTYNSIQ